MTDIISEFTRPSAELVKGISLYPPATLHEAQGRMGAVDSRIKPIYQGMRLCGPAVTATSHPGDNLMLITAISVAKPGDVLVVSAGDHPQQGGFGEVLATACKARGIAGLVTDAGARDGSAIQALGFNVFCYGLSVKGTVKETVGRINHPITLGGVVIRPGDIISADDDGVVVVPQEDIARVTEQSAAREEREARLMQSLRDGADVLSLLGMDKVLEKKGARFA